MNKEAIIYMLQKILYKYEMQELKNVLKEMVLFFVLQILEIELIFRKVLKALKYNYLRACRLGFQFSVSDSGFSVLIPVSGNFNSLYPAPDSLKMKKQWTHPALKKTT